MGKSTLCTKIKAEYSDIVIISKDEIFDEILARSEKTGPFDLTETHKQAMKTLSTLLQLVLRKPGVRIILDCFNSYPYERKEMLFVLKQMGADRVVCWQFTTPIEISLPWYLEREKSKFNGHVEVAHFAAMEHRGFFEKYWRNSQNIKSEGFDQVHKFDPRELTDLSLIM